MRENDVCLSCRIRLARNVEDLPFVHRMSQVQADGLINRVSDLFKDKDYTLMRMLDVGDNDRVRLVEEHLASRELIVEPKGALLFNRDKTISIMINEEDHLRIQCILDGLNLEQANGMARQVDEELSTKLPYAFDDTFGYLTACPTNIGTGLRASAMLHIPALVRSGQAERVLSATAKLGLAVRGFYGEGTGAPGDIYQISNQVTLGIDEDEIVALITQTVKEIIEQELRFREVANAQDKAGVVDMVSRSLGICKYAHRMGFTEFMRHCSNLKLGVSLGIVEGLTQQQINQLINAGQGAVLCATEGRLLNEQEENIVRARIVREAMGNGRQEEQEDGCR